MQFSEILDEICKVCAVRATTALSKFLAVPVGINMQPIEVKNVEALTELLNNKEDSVNIYLNITGTLPGACFFIYSEKDAMYLCDILFHREHGTTKKIAEMEKSALLEVANIVLGNFLNSFAHSLQLKSLLHRAPNFDEAPLMNTFNKATRNMSNHTSESIVKISFSFQHINLKGYVLIVFEERKLDQVLKELAIDWNNLV